MQTQAPLDFMFLQRVINYGPVSAFIHKMIEMYGSLKKNSTFKVVFEKAEHTLDFIQPYLPNVSNTIQKNNFLTKLDQFSCRQLDHIEYGYEKTKEILDKDMMTNMKNASACVQERVIKPVGGPMKDYVDTKVEMISDKLKDPEVQEKIAPIQEFVVEKAHYVHDQIENNSQFEAIKPHYERALAQVSLVVETLSNMSQAEENYGHQEETVTADTEDETQIFENDEDDSTNFNYLRYNMTYLKQSF